MTDKHEEIIFKEKLDEAVEDFGTGSQEGAKFAIKACQDDFAFVSLGHQKQIAQAFGLDEKIIKTIIKFIPSVKELKVEYEIVCCTGPRCAKNGSMEVLKTVKSTLGLDFNETSKDGRIRLRSQNCFKKCKFGPNIMINGEFYHHMDKGKAKKILDDIVNN